MEINKTQTKQAADELKISSAVVYKVNKPSIKESTERIAPELIQELQKVTDTETTEALYKLAEKCRAAVEEQGSLLRLVLNAEMLKRSRESIEERIKEVFRELGVLSTLMISQRLESLARLGYLKQAADNNYAPDVEALIFEMKEALSCGEEESTLGRWLEYLDNETPSSDKKFFTEIEEPIKRKVFLKKLAEPKAFADFLKVKIEKDLDGIRTFVALQIPDIADQIKAGDYDDQLLESLLSVAEEETPALIEALL